MIGASNLPKLICTTVQSANSQRAAVEKSSPSNSLDMGRRDAGPAAHLRDRARAGAGESRNETGARAPVWNGPRLKPAFVAQILSQASSAAELNAISARTAYSQTEIVAAPGRVFNEIA